MLNSSEPYSDTPCRPPKGLRYLLVDDEPLILLVLTNFLSNTDGYFTKASNSAEAFAAFEKDYFDVIITDLFMPGMDGVTLARILKRRHPTLKVILMSGINPPAIHGGDAFLLKPFTQNQLITTVNEITQPGVVQIIS